MLIWVIMLLYRSNGQHDSRLPAFEIYIYTALLLIAYRIEVDTYGGVKQIMLALVIMPPIRFPANNH